MSQLLLTWLRGIRCNFVFTQSWALTLTGERITCKTCEQQFYPATMTKTEQKEKSSLPFLSFILVNVSLYLISILHLNVLKWLCAESVGGTNHFNEPCCSSSSHLYACLLGQGSSWFSWQALVVSVCGKGCVQSDWFSDSHRKKGNPPTDYTVYSGLGLWTC